MPRAVPEMCPTSVAGSSSPAPAPSRHSSPLPVRAGVGSSWFRPMPPSLPSAPALLLARRKHYLWMELDALRAPASHPMELEGLVWYERAWHLCRALS